MRRLHNKTTKRTTRSVLTVYKFMKLKKCLFLLLLAAAMSGPAIGQNKVAIKSNLLYDAAANANLGLEFGLAPRWSLDISADYNQWAIREHKWKHWFVQPEARYWFCEHLVKHFIGLHAIGGQYNIGNIPLGGFKFLGTDLSQLADYRYQGWGVGAGVAYGYAVPMGRHWNMEFEVGVGYVYLDYDKFQCKECGRQIGSGVHNYIGPTKAAINLVYVF